MDSIAQQSFLMTLGAGVVGGLILNVMPCVLPGLFFKVQRVIHQLHEEGEGAVAHRRAEGLAFLGGSLSAFSLFALVVILLRASGQSFGWGMQMQSAPFVGGLMLMTLLFALNAFEVFELNLGVVQRGGAADQGSLTSAYLEGVFITLISTPCSAPILGTAITAALASDGAWWETVALFWSIGLGLSIPVLLVSFTPIFAKLVPRPGEWTMHFKRLVGVSLVAATLWLYTQYENLVSKEQAHNALYALCAISAATLAPAMWRSSPNTLKRYALNLITLGLAVWSLVWASREPVEHLDWRPFNEATLKQTLAGGRAAFVDFTADWCQSCKAFEGVYLNKAGTAELFREHNVAPLKADLTKNDDALWALLKTFGRDALPTYILYHADGTAEVLPEGPPLTLRARVMALPQGAAQSAPQPALTPKLSSP